MMKPEPDMSRQCLNCKHLFKGGKWGIACDAFPEEIPDDILDGGEFDHTKPFPGDNGIRFEEREDQ